MSIELPVDANGMTVPLDTSVMYRDDNSRFPVTDFFYEAIPNRWFARNGNICIETSRLHLQTRKKNCYEQLIADDSWDKLIDDLDRAYHEPKADDTLCAYTGRSRKQNKCRHCRFNWTDKICEKSTMLDIEFRIRKLLGENLNEWPEGKGLRTLYEYVECESDAK